MPTNQSQSPLSILILTCEGDMAGSTNSISYLARGLAARGHRVFLGIRKEALLNDLVTGSDVVPIHMTFASKTDPENMRQIRDAVRNHQIQIINAQSGKDRYTSILANWRYRLKVKIIFTRRQMSKSFGLLSSGIVNLGTDGIVAVSESVKKSLTDKGIQSSKITVIQNGTPREKYLDLDPEKTEELLKKYGIKAGDFVIGCVSRPKEQDQILQAIGILPFPVKAIFLGIESTSDYERIISTFELPHQIYFEGNLTGSEVLNHYRLFQVSILASVMEGLSQSLLEAMYLKVPVIATRAGGNPDLITHQKTGLLFDDNDIKSLASFIEKIYSDPNLGTDLATNAYQLVQDHYLIDRVVDEYEAYFYRLLAN